MNYPQSAQNRKGVNLRLTLLEDKIETNNKLCSQFLLGVKMAPRENENKAYAKFGGDKQRTLWYVMVFSGVVNYVRLSSIYL